MKKRRSKKNLNLNQKIDAPPRLESRGLNGARFLDARKIFYGFFCTENCNSKQFSCARESPRSKERGFQDSRHNKLSIKKQFNESILYLKSSSNFIYSSILLFILSAIFGFLNSNNLSFIDELLKEIISKTSNLNPIELIFFIMQNNMLSALMALAGGIILGIMPIFNAVSNGVVIGYVMSKTYKIAGAAILLRLIPHGVFELPAIFISLGLGIKLGFSIFSKKNKSQEFLRRFYNSANVFLIIVIPLLIIAAVIEGLLIAFIG